MLAQCSLSLRAVWAARLRGQQPPGGCSPHAGPPCPGLPWHTLAGSPLAGTLAGTRTPPGAPASAGPAPAWWTPPGRPPLPPAAPCWPAGQEAQRAGACLLGTVAGNSAGVHEGYMRLATVRGWLGSAGSTSAGHKQDALGQWSPQAGGCLPETAGSTAPGVSYSSQAGKGPTSCLASTSSRSCGRRFRESAESSRRCTSCTASARAVLACGREGAAPGRPPRNRQQESSASSCCTSSEP